MGMLGRCFSIFLLLLMVFASSSNADFQFQCHQFKFNKGDVDMKDAGLSDPKKPCSGCTLYYCKKPNGKIISGTGCTEYVNEKCQQGWDQDTIEYIAFPLTLRTEKDKYATYTCLTQKCNDFAFIKQSAKSYKSQILSAGLLKCFFNKKQVDCDAVPSTYECNRYTTKELNEMSGDSACIWNGDTSKAKQFMICNNGACKCYNVEGTKGTEGQCDRNPKLAIYWCDKMTEKEKATFNEGTHNACPAPGDQNPNGVELSRPDENGGTDADDDENDADVTPPSTTVAPGASGAETIGDDFALLMAPLLAFLF